MFHFRFFSILQPPLPALLLVVQKMVNWSDWELTLSSDCTIALRTLRTLKIPLSVAIYRRDMGRSGFGNYFIRLYFYNCFQEFDLGNKGRRHHIILWPLPLEHSATATGLRLPAIPRQIPSKCILSYLSILFKSICPEGQECPHQKTTDRAGDFWWLIWFLWGVLLLNFCFWNRKVTVSINFLIPGRHP